MLRAALSRSDRRDTLGIMMRIFVLKNANSKVETLLMKYCFKVAPKIFVSFSMSLRIEDYIFGYCEVFIKDEGGGMLMLREGKASQIIVRTIGDTNRIDEIDDVMLFQ